MITLKYDRFPKKVFSLVFFNLLYLFTWFSLFNCSLYLVKDYFLATVFFPVGLRIGALLLSPITHWRSVLLSELVLLCGLTAVLPDFTFSPLYFVVPLVSTGFCLLLKPWHKRWTSYWQQLLLLIIAVFLHAVVISVVCASVSYSLDLMWYSFLSSMTGGVIIAPFLYLLVDFLFRNVWRPVLPSIAAERIELAPMALIWALCFFAVAMLSVTTVLKQWPFFVYFIVLLPNIFMAYRYGWQGGVLATVMNSMLLAGVQYILGAFHSAAELQIFLLTQALIGLGLGIAISRQYLLAIRLHESNERLKRELSANQKLTRQLVDVEEQIRKAIARELHDEIGQNITAIQIQTMLIEKTSKEEKTKVLTSTVNDLAQQIHTVTRNLLTQLRPHALDTLGLDSALKHLADELRFEERKISLQLNIGVDTQLFDEVLRITLYRMVQELLNNAAKYSKANEIYVNLYPGESMTLEYRDNGVGLPRNWRDKGHGLLGIQERVHVLGGRLQINEKEVGTHILIKLPNKE